MFAKHASAIQMFRAEKARRVADLRAERERITADDSYTGGERERALRPIEAKLKDIHAEYRANAADWTARAEKSLIENTAQRVQLKAAYNNPARAVAMRQLAEGMSGKAIGELAALALEEHDGASAFGLRSALSPRLADVGASDPPALAASALLAQVGAPDWESARADYVATMSQAAALELDGPFGEPQGDVAALAAANRAYAIPNGDGTTTTINDTEKARLIALAGVE